MLIHHNNSRLSLVLWDRYGQPNWGEISAAITRLKNFAPAFQSFTDRGEQVGVTISSPGEELTKEQAQAVWDSFIDVDDHPAYTVIDIND